MQATQTPQAVACQVQGLDVPQLGVDPVQGGDLVVGQVHVHKAAQVLRGHRQQGQEIRPRVRALGTDSKAVMGLPTQNDGLCRLALLPLTSFQKGNFFPAQLYRANTAHSVGLEAGFENKAVRLHSGGIIFITSNVYLYFGS